MFFALIVEIVWKLAGFLILLQSFLKLDNFCIVDDEQWGIPRTEREASYEAKYGHFEPTIIKNDYQYNLLVLFKSFKTPLNQQDGKDLSRVKASFKSILPQIVFWISRKRFQNKVEEEPF